MSASSAIATRLRLTLALLLGLDLLHAVLGCWLVTRTTAPPGDATVTWVVARSWLAPGLALVVGGLALARFGARPGRLGWGWVALGALFVPLFAFTGIARGFHGHFLHAGATLFGWLVAGGLSGWLASSSPPAERDRWGAVGALAAFAATHVNAGLAKLGGLGADAVRPWIIQLSLHMDHPMGEVSPLAPIWQPVLASPALAGAVAWLFLLAELGAILLLARPAVRRAAAAALLVYHALMSTLFGMVFHEALVLLVVLAWPRSDWAAGISARAGGPRRLAVWAATCSAVCVLVLAWPAEEGASPQAGASVAVAATVQPAPEELDGAEPLERFGPLSMGASLPGGWTVEGLGRTPRMAVITLRHADSREVRLILAAADVPAGPFDAGSAILGYRSRTVPLEAFEAAAREVAARVRRAGAGDEAEAVSRWLSAPLEPRPTSP